MSQIRPISRRVTAHRQTEGGGFIVRRPFPSGRLLQVDPFLLLDEMGPVDYAPGEAVGAPDHPHRGFETVTYLLAGEMEHEDSAGHRGALTPGDVQWMTAGAGVIHSEMPSRRVQRDGGRVHGFQIWVNLPRTDKLMAPRYQEVPAAGIPTARDPGDRVSVRVVAGEALGARAVIDTRTPIAFLDWTIEPGGTVTQPLRPDFQALVYVFGGTLHVSGDAVPDGDMAILGDGDAVTLAVPAGATEPARALLLAGTPLGEPVARYGPFVMNTEEEIHAAIRDYQSGRFGEIARAAIRGDV